LLQCGDLATAACSGDEALNSLERRSVIGLAGLYAMRMLGLFMVIPVFMLLGRDLEGATDFTLGLAIGVYGLSQAVLQIPFGFLADRWGRKPVIVGGLLLFAAGSVIAALATSVEMVILGRLLQGSGAISAAVLALLTDLTREEQRTKAMAVIGMTIGLSFAVALVLGPLLGDWFGLAGLFWFTAGMALLGIPVTLWVVPTPAHSQPNRESGVVQNELVAALRNKDLLRLDMGIFTLHMALTGLFVAIPLTLTRQLSVEQSDHWMVYLSVMGLGFIAMVPFVIIAEKKRRMREVFLGAILTLSIAAFSMYWTSQSLVWFWLSLFGFFMAFNLLEATLPSLISKVCPPGGKGSAMGIYSSSQFFGAFIGGVLGGFVAQVADLSGVYLIVALLGLLWWIIARTMPPIRYATSFVLKLQAVEPGRASEILADLLAIPGVEDATVIVNEQTAYLKVDKTILDEQALLQYRFAAR